jgi:ABC-type glutathione transport system ATPase component
MLLAVRDLRLWLPTPSGERAVLSGVDLDVAAGECVGVLGESGAGKSSLANVLLGLVPAGARLGGKLIFAGEELLGASAGRWQHVRGSGIGAVFQDPGASLAPHRRLGAQLEDVLAVRRRRGLSAPRGAAWCRRVQLPDDPASLRRFPHELSGGERQRAAVALALAAGPRLLVADEPTSALDPPLALELLRLLARLSAEEGLAVLFVSHELSHVAALTERVAVLDAGRIVESGPTPSLYAAPREAASRRLLSAGSAP